MATETRTDGVRRKTFSGRGRKPRQGVARYPSGGIVHKERGESEAEILATVKAYRARLGVPASGLMDQKAESFFGRLALQGEISAVQYEAGRRFARTVARYTAQQGFAQPWPRPIDLEGSAWGLSGRPEPEPDEIDQVRAAYADMRAALADLEKSATYHGTTRLLWDIILMDRSAFSPANGIGNLRAGLNVLARRWGMGR